MRLSLDLNLGDGYLIGDADSDFASYKINIQQGWPDTTLIVPTELKLNAGQALIVFETGAGDQIPLKANLKNEDTDMIWTLYRSRNLERFGKEVSCGYGYTEGFSHRLE